MQITPYAKSNTAKLMVNNMKKLLPLCIAVSLLGGCANNIEQIDTSASNSQAQAETLTSPELDTAQATIRCNLRARRKQPDTDYI